MIRACICVGSKWYQGEDLDKTVKCNLGGGGWYSFNQSERNTLNFTCDKKKAKIITGKINLKSEINRILDHMQEGFISVQSILIKMEENS